MTPAEIRDLRRALKLTAKRLAEQLGVQPELVFDWEKGERFPTKRHCEAMRALRSESSTPVEPIRTASAMARLADPDVWAIVRKLISSSEFLNATRELAARYPDPADDA